MKSYMIRKTNTASISKQQSFLVAKILIQALVYTLVHMILTVLLLYSLIRLLKIITSMEKMLSTLAIWITKNLTAHHLLIMKLR